VDGLLETEPGTETRASQPAAIIFSFSFSFSVGQNLSCLLAYLPRLEGFFSERRRTQSVEAERFPSHHPLWRSDFFRFRKKKLFFGKQKSESRPELLL
jgi:hypothetical protein